MRPLGLMAIHSYLAAEFGDELEIAIIDVSGCDEDSYHYIDHHQIPAYDIVGLCAYSTNFMITREWAVEIKRRNPECITVVGGPQPTALPVHVANTHSDAFDYVVRGEGELPMAALIRSLQNGDPRPDAPGLAYKKGLWGVVGGDRTDYVKDLDSIPPPLTTVISPYDYSMTYWDRLEQRLRRAVAMTTSRGCPFACTFCSIRASNSKWRAVSAERLGDWIDEAFALEDSEVEHVYFMDADFLINKKRVIDIGNMFERRFPRLTWSFSGRVDDLARIGEDALRKLTTQGLRAIEVGIESGSQASLDRLGKRVSVQQNYDAVAMLKRLNVELIIDFINFLPDETPEQLGQTLEFLRGAGLTEEFPASHLFTHLLLYPATPLRNYYQTLFGADFSSDVLPEPDDLFSHPGTKQIFKLFVHEFKPIFNELTAVIRQVEEAALKTRATEPELAQFLRLETISLKHIPFLVMEQLIDDWDHASLLEAVPWLARVPEHIKQLEALCARPTRAISQRVAASI